MYAPLQAMWVTPRGHKALVDFRDDTNDWNTITSALTADEYGLREVTVSGVAWDIGAHIGTVTLALLLDNPNLRVVAVEPVETNARLLWANAFQNALLDRVLIVEAAAGPPGIGETRLHTNFRGSVIADHHAFIGVTDLGNREFADSWRNATDHDILTVPVVDFDNLVARTGAMPSLIKIDCEGAEYGFLSAPGACDVPVILGEWHNIPYQDRDRSHREDLAALLPQHTVTFSGPEDGPGGFLAVRHG